MKISIKNNKIDKIYLLVFFWTTCMQNFSLISFTGFTLKLYHTVAILYLPLLVRKRRIKLLPRLVIAFFVLLVLITMINAFDWGINPFLFNYMFAIYSLILVINIGENFALEDWIDIIRIVSIIMSILVWIKMAINYQNILYFIRNPYIGHPELTTFFGGGVNLEASYLAMMIPAFMTDKHIKRRLFYIVSSVLICVLYSSRTAILICLISIVFILIHEKKKKMLFLVVPLGITVMIYIYIKIDLSFFLNRFSSISTESGVLGRYRMWMYAWPLFWNRIIGYGIGNSIPALMKYTGELYRESNFHNLYMQMFIDLGFIGGFYYCFLVIYFFVRERKNIIKNPLHLIMLLYFFSGLFEFRGAEIIIYFFFAGYLQQIRKHKEKRGE